MNESSWDDSRMLLSHGNMAAMRQTGNLSKDDAGVSYFFQRPQEHQDTGGYSNKKWAVGDDSVLEQVSIWGFRCHVTCIMCLCIWLGFPRSVIHWN